MYSCWKKTSIILIFSIVGFFLFGLAALEAATLRLDQTKIRITASPGQAKNGDSSWRNFILSIYVRQLQKDCNSHKENIHLYDKYQAVFLF